MIVVVVGEGMAALATGEKEKVGGVKTMARGTPTHIGRERDWERGRIYTDEGKIGLPL